MGSDMLLYFGMFAVSLFVLLRASDRFVDSAEEIGLSLGISPFIIGVTIIAFGTSLPELATSIAAVLEGDSKIVVGEMYDLPGNWHKDDVVEFQVPVLDSLKKYNVFFHIRNTNDYPFNNLFLIASME